MKICFNWISPHLKSHPKIRGILKKLQKHLKSNSGATLKTITLSTTCQCKKVQKHLKNNFGVTPKTTTLSTTRHIGELWLVEGCLHVDLASPLRQPQLATWASCGQNCGFGCGTRINHLLMTYSYSEIHIWHFNLPPRNLYLMLQSTNLEGQKIVRTNSFSYLTNCCLLYFLFFPFVQYILKVFN